MSAGEDALDPEEIRRRYGRWQSVASGSTGAVHLAFDRKQGCRVAIKTLRAPTPAMLRRLKDEFRVRRGIRHRNLVRMYRLHRGRDGYFFTMEWIDGEDFVAFVRRPSPEPLWRRLCTPLFGLAAGLRALHRARYPILHRDIKPQNVLVQKDGRAVLVDFGLSIPAADAPAGTIGGTPDYMSPEQRAGGSLTPGTDWYSAGVMIYESLTGHLPPGSSSAGSAATRPMTARRALLGAVPEAPNELVDLVVAMLALDATQRPDAEDVFAWLGRVGHASPPPSVDAFTSLVGRREEMAELSRAFSARSSQQARITCLEGVPGIGKTALAEALLSEREGRGDLVLRGKCNPDETIPFNALDGIVDDLSRFLTDGLRARLGLSSEHFERVQKLFPVLARASGAENAPERLPEPEEDDNDQTIDRNQALLVLNDLLERLSALLWPRALILLIDDFQWADVDSLTVIHRLAQMTQHTNVFWLLLQRSDDAAPEPLESRRQLDRAGLAMRRVSLGPLDLDDARRLARLTAPDATLGDATTEAIARESGGAPGMVRLLATHAPLLAGQAVPLSVSAVLDALVSELDEPERSFLEVLSVARVPLHPDLVASAATVAHLSIDDLDALSDKQLLSEEHAGLVSIPSVIRDPLSKILSNPSVRSAHLNLAQSLETLSDAGAGRALVHYVRAGELGLACRSALQAAERAAAQLAFAQAADLYRTVDQLGSLGIQRSELLSRLGRALANAGHAREGAVAFEAAADALPPGDAKLDRALRRRAATLFLLSGHLDRGLAVLREPMKVLGVYLPTSARDAILRTFFELGLLWFRGLRFNASDAPDRSPSIERIDLCHTLSTGLSAFDLIRAAYFAVHALRAALRVGDTRRVSRSLLMVGVGVLAPGAMTQRLAHWGIRMIESSRDLSAALGDPALQGAVDVALAQCHLFEGRWSEALELSVRGIASAENRRRGLEWESNAGRVVRLRALEELGRIADLTSATHEWLRRSEDLEDNYGGVTALLNWAFLRLAAGDPAGAREATEQVRSRRTRRGFHLPQLYALRVDTLADLYEGLAERALERMNTEDGRIQRSGLLRVALSRIDICALRARATLAVALRHPSDHRLLRSSERLAARLESERRSEATAHAGLIRAGVARMHGDPVRALRHLERSRSLYERKGMVLHEAFAQFGEGSMDADRSGRKDQALRRLHDQGIAEPARWLNAWAPGFIEAPDAG